jgi:hypothetical protein
MAYQKKLANPPTVGGLDKKLHMANIKGTIKMVPIAPTLGNDLHCFARVAPKHAPNIAKNILTTNMVKPLLELGTAFSTASIVANSNINGPADSRVSAATLYVGVRSRQPSFPDIGFEFNLILILKLYSSLPESLYLFY